MGVGKLSPPPVGLGLILDTLFSYPDIFHEIPSRHGAPEGIKAIDGCFASEHDVTRNFRKHEPGRSLYGSGTDILRAFNG